MTPEMEFIDICGRISVGLLVAAMVLVLWRLAKGPTAPDRVIAMDLLSILVVAFLVVLSMVAREISYLDVAIAYACIAFLGTIALARFIEKASQHGSCQVEGGASDE